MWKFQRGPSRFKFDCRKRYRSDAVTNRTCNNNDDGFSMFCCRCCNRSRMSALSDCGRWTPLRYWVPPLHLSDRALPLIGTWNRVSEKSSFVTLFNLGLLAPPSLPPPLTFKHFGEKSKTEERGREGGCRCCWLRLLEQFVRVGCNAGRGPRYSSSVDGFHLQKKQEADISVVSPEKSKEAGVRVSGRYTMYIKQGLADGGKRNSGPLEWSPSEKINIILHTISSEWRK